MRIYFTPSATTGASLHISERICRGRKKPASVNRSPVPSAIFSPTPLTSGMGRRSFLPQYWEASTTTPSPTEETIICKRN